MEIIIISISAFVIAILTFFSGFGLGTILTPIFMLFFPVDLAIGLTGIVHLFNNIFKLILVGKHANKNILLQFGIPAVIAAIAGSLVLVSMVDLKPLFVYELFDKEWEVYPIKLTVSILLIVFAGIDLVPFFDTLQFSKKKLFIGGALSGFFGGLTGNQGALRSAFLIKAGLSKESFIATAVVISIFVDFTRLSIYASKLVKAEINENLTLISFAVVSAVSGAYIGNRLLKKVTLHVIRILVAIMLILISIALGAGFI